ncbi:ATP-dependent nuclease [Raoultibacter phocaeensis]|uniref:ATP-dependent nuclease n=1 Tax=Raoultibacter phocaeensis TaxID=2479841 RepID=UPI0015D5AD2B|nr:AAA family ATPase [Raoultibacter phocaeensis]
MRIESVRIKGFRNFDDETVCFARQTLVIGANDVGKTNLIYALRILFDKSLSARDLELLDSDYNVYTRAEKIEITAKLKDVHEDCLVSEFGGGVDDDGTLLVRYRNSKTGEYEIYTGFNEENMRALPGRTYLKSLNLEYVKSNRDLGAFLRREKTKILSRAKENLEEAQARSDDEDTMKIQGLLNGINETVGELNFVKESLTTVNKELSDLSIQNSNQTVSFVAGSKDASTLLDNLVLSYTAESLPIALGGDGRNNQVFLATWIAQQNISRSIDKVTMFAVEEPEAHLHPHQQRKMSDYLRNKFKEQVFVTTHSPHIASAFTPKEIARLYEKNGRCTASAGGCSDTTKVAFDDFGYRINAISSEAYFSNGILLVEGISEKLLYTALSESIGIDLDRLNATVLSVDGVGFKPYAKICKALEIPYAIRTDNDIFVKTEGGKKKSYYAGLTRLMGIYADFKQGESPLLDLYVHDYLKCLTWDSSLDRVPDDVRNCANTLTSGLAEIGFFVAGSDLEGDLADSSLVETLEDYYKTSDQEDLVKVMQAKKAENMYKFLAENQESIKSLKGSSIVEPLEFVRDAVIGSVPCAVEVAFNE